MKIATRIRLFAPGMVFVTAVLVGLVVNWGYRSLVDAERIRGLTARAEADGNRVILTLRQFQDDLNFLADLPKIAEFIEADRLNSTVIKLSAEQQIAGIFTSLLENRPFYDQVRLIGVADSGKELIRAERRQGSIARVSGDDLQQKGHREYVQETIALGPGHIYVSGISLNRERGELEVPHRAAFRIAKPLNDSSGDVYGLVIINLNFNSYIRSLLPVGDSGFDYFVTNSDGGYVLHPDPAMEFGFDLGLSNTLPSDYPELSALFSAFAGVDVLTATAGAAGDEPRLLQARRLYPFYNEPFRYIVLAVEAPADSIAASWQAIGTRVLLVTIVLLAVASAFAFVFAQRMTKPLKQLTQAADRVSNREDATFVHSHRADEIGTLSRALDHMLDSLRKNELALQESLQDLEYFSRIASHDLAEPARRIAAFANLVQVEESERLSEDGGKLLERLRTEGLNMIQQLTDMRAFARLGSGELVRENTDLQALVEQVLADRQEEISQREIVVVVDSLPTVPVYANIVQVLYQNLIDNALQHAGQRSFELTIDCRESGGQTIFGVCNTGSSIDVGPEKLFAAFYTGSEDASRSGLGLSICRRIIERHAGRIWAETEGNEVRFLFTLVGDAS